MNEPKMSRSKALVVKTLYAAMQVLREHDGELRGKEVIEKVGKRVELDEWAKTRYEKSGRIRWQSILSFHTSGCLKAGYLLKKNGIWYLTPEGEKALELGDIGLFDAMEKGYAKWKEAQPQVEDSDDVPDEATVTFDEIQQQAISSLENHIRALNAYEFQDLTAALLRGMKYFTPFVAPRGKDGGIDVIAYRDPLGTVAPRIKVQVKHRESAASVQEIRQLMGLLQSDGDVGIFISSGGFTNDAKSTARHSQVHIELVDLPRFISLWQEFYDDMTDEDKAQMPLAPVYFLAPPVG